jgi:hypothetical protein
MRLSSSDVGEGIVDGSFFWLALMLLEIGLQLLLGFDGVGYQLAVCPEGQFADIAVGSAGSAPDEPDDDEFTVRHRVIMAGCRRRSQMRSTQWLINTGVRCGASEIIYVEPTSVAE